jgi:hypothetical protein
MSALRNAVGVLETAETTLRKLLGGAANEGDYDAVILIAEWAKSLGDLLARPRPSVAPTAEVATPILEQPLGVGMIGDSGARRSESPETPASNTPPARRARNAKEYPKFFRNGDVLVKLGWSKSQRAEYEHKAPLTVIRDLAAGICQVTSKKKQFAMDAILPLRNSVDGLDIPSYQSYACLSWLRQEGLIIQHGRQGYSIRPKTDLTTALEESFHRLSER